MATRVEELAAQRAALPPEALLPAYRLDEATRERYKSIPIKRGTAPTKAEQLTRVKLLKLQLSTKTDLAIDPSNC